MMVLYGKLNICQQKLEICMLKYLRKFENEGPSSDSYILSFSINEMQVGECIISLVKKMDDRFVQATGKKAKVREVGL